MLGHSLCLTLLPSMAWAQSVVRTTDALSVGSKGQGIDRMDKSTGQSAPKNVLMKEECSHHQFGVTIKTIMSPGFCQQFEMNRMKQTTGQDRQTDARLARQRHS